jgi:hypothetical protein
MVSLRCIALSTSNQQTLNLKGEVDEDIGNGRHDGGTFGDERDRTVQSVLSVL